MKKGQLALFIIAAITVVFLFMFVFYLRSAVSETRTTQVTKQTIQGTTKTTAVQNYVVECIEAQIETAVRDRLGPQGGYLTTTGAPEYGDAGVPGSVGYYVFGAVNAPYYLVGGLNTVPVIWDIDRRILNYVAVELESCLDFTVFEQFTISKPDPTYYPAFDFDLVETDFQVEVRPEDVAMDAVYPLTVEGQNVFAEFEDFHGTANVRFGMFYTFANQLVDILIAEPNEFDITTACGLFADPICPPGEGIWVAVLDQTQVDPPPDPTYNYVVRINDSSGFEFLFALNNEKIVNEKCGC